MSIKRRSHHRHLMASIVISSLGTAPLRCDATAWQKVSITCLAVGVFICCSFAIIGCKDTIKYGKIQINLDYFGFSSYLCKQKLLL